jgi:hypothetical protein
MAHSVVEQISDGESASVIAGFHLYFKFNQAPAMHDQDSNLQEVPLL